MSGSGTLRPGWFALLPIPRRALGRGLLVSVYVSIAAALVLAALLAVSLHAALLDPVALVVAIPGALLTWVLVIALSRLVYGLLGAAMGSRIGIEIASVQFGLMFAGMFAGWIPVTIAIQRTPDLLATGITDPVVTRGLDMSPTSWSVLAVERAARGDWAGAFLLLGALALCAGAVVAAAVPLLVPSANPRTQRRRGRRRSAGLVAGGGFLPRTQTGAVISKEIRQWSRDGWRMLEVQSAVWGGVLIGALALTSEDLRVIAAFSGLFVAFMLGIAACTMYGRTRPRSGRTCTAGSGVRCWRSCPRCWWSRRPSWCSARPGGRSRSCSPPHPPCSGPPPARRSSWPPWGCHRASTRGSGWAPTTPSGT
jgi:ABC-2 type transport system permease protein